MVSLRQIVEDKVSNNFATFIPMHTVLFRFTNLYNLELHSYTFYLVHSHFNWQRLIFVPTDDAAADDDSDDDGESSDESSSSEDSNDSMPAAHAAAIGHSPRAMSITKSSMACETPAKDDSGKMDSEPSVNKVVEVKKELGINVEDATGLISSHSENGKSEGATKPQEAGIETPEPSHDTDTLATAKFISGQREKGAREVADNRCDIEQTVSPLTNGGISLPKKSSTTKRNKGNKYYCPYDLNERDEDENTALHVAVHARKLEQVKLLLKAGVSMNKKCDGSFPIHTAISIGAIPGHEIFAHACVEAMVEIGADISVKDDSLYTPLYLACMMNQPRIVKFILSKTIGRLTLNMRADRSGGRPLHAAAKFENIGSTGPYRRGPIRTPLTVPPTHHPDGTLAQSHTPGGNVTGDSGDGIAQGKNLYVVLPELSPEKTVTEILLSTAGIEIDAQNATGQTALHVACSRGNWHVVRLLLHFGASPTILDRRGYSPGEVSHKRGMPIPNDLLTLLGRAPTTGLIAPPRDLIVDPDSSTLLICHELCLAHRSCPPIRRDTDMDPPPENVRRLHVLINEHDGILRSNEFGRIVWEGKARRAAIADVLMCHEYNYVESISQICSTIQDHPSAISHLDADTAVSRWSFEAAMHAAGSVCQAVDKIMSGEHRNAFCAVRPPGHHAGPRGIVRCTNDPEGGSHGFCLLNNVAIGAAYARSMYRNDGISKIAIVDFDVHHGNGTEEIIRQLYPGIDKASIRTPFAVGELVSARYRPWLDETDCENVFFASTHGYGSRGQEMAEHQGPQSWFYPASGKTHTSDAIRNPNSVDTPNQSAFILSQTWTRMGDDTKANCCKIINCGLGLPSKEALPGMQRLELRDTYRKKIFPALRDFDPDIIFVSAGFDAHRKDTMNFGYVGMVEDDYEWVTEQLVKIANTCCNGRIVSVLEGGYKIHGGVISPFARSVASHVRGLVDGGRSRELYDPSDGEWESQFERHIIEERERKRQQRSDRLHLAAELSRRQQQQHEVEAMMKEPLNDNTVTAADTVATNLASDDGDQPARKRRRNQVDYQKLYEEMKQEGVAS